jgi:hypothetical protein
MTNIGTSTITNPSRLQLSHFLSRSREEGIRMEVIFYLLEEQLSNQDWKRKLRGKIIHSFNVMLQVILSPSPLPSSSLSLPPLFLLII